MRTGFDSVQVLHWLDETGGVKNKSVCDCGCGTGSLAIPLALRGAAITASDISAAMVGEAEKLYQVRSRCSGACRPVGRRIGW